MRARERFRAAKLAELEKEERTLGEQLEACEGRIRGYEAEKALLLQEWNLFPADTDLKEAAREYADKNYELKRLNEQIAGARERLRQIKAELDEIQMRVREVCSKCYLTARLDIFTEVLDSLGQYRELFTKIRVCHGSYLSGIFNLNTLADTLEAIEQDLDTIRYELGRLSRKKSDLEAALHSVQEQLKLTDYDKIKREAGLLP